MNWLNCHHLHYFWMVAQEGSISRAAEQLHLAQPTLSSQIKMLEKSFGTELFRRVGRGLVLTEAGSQAYRYAEEIFVLGRELSDTLQGRPSPERLNLAVGVPDVLPKLLVYRFLRPALKMDERVRIRCYEGKLDQILADLALHRLDIVLADSPLTPQAHVKGFAHLLGECGITLFGTRQLAAKYGRGFPRSLSGAPMLLPTQNTSLRRELERWFDELEIRPDVTHEFEDSAVLKVFGQAGEGFFAAPTAIEREVIEQYSV